MTQRSMAQPIGPMAPAVRSCDSARTAGTSRLIAL